MATIMNAQRLLAKIKDSIAYDLTTTEFVEAFEGLTEELDQCYTLIRQLQSRPPAEVSHALTNLIEQCCCLYWRERMNSVSGDFCPDCYLHGAKAGMKQGEFRLKLGPKSKK